MKKTIFVLVLILVAFTAMAAVSSPSAHGNDSKSRIYYFVHPYIAYHTYTYAPVVYYPRVYVAPVYHVYPVYTYSYWYYKYAGWKH